jgi:hypothetical protein
MSGSGIEKLILSRIHEMPLNHCSGDLRWRTTLGQLC